MYPDIASFDRCSILVVGDLMIDEYVRGDVERISPEAPVQIVSVIDDYYTLGGAGNVVNNLVALGAKVSVAGVAGKGNDGKRLLKLFHQLGVNTDAIIQESGRPTTIKTRIIAANQHVLRIDRETRKEISDRTREMILQFLQVKIPEADVVLISDYGKGLISGILLSKVTQLARASGKITIADPKGLNFSKYTGVTLLTPNKKEAALACGMEIVDELSLNKAGEKILNAVPLNHLLITCGQDGMVYFKKNAKPYKIKAQARQVFDVSGAGDTVLAVLALAVASGASFEAGAELANTAAGIVVGKVGTATVSKDELTCALGLVQK
ncbi:MAG: D-glycero-beta-D-manno-heptose-7-phosphate kinase [Desulfobacterales bacterium]|nr:D-glycero-beta-D-manno-heptose-7-phosphate kinase [Desulfobacterales bacterium]